MRIQGSITGNTTLWVAQASRAGTAREGMAMQQVVIENPILNSPFSEPTRHFRFSDEGITNEIVEARRVSSYFIPIAQPKKKGKLRILGYDD